MTHAEPASDAYNRGRLSTTGIPAPGDIVDGKYRIEREIGRGGMAVVLAATQLLARREVAIKWLLPVVARSEHVVARFLREAQAAARIEHPSVVSVLDVGRSGEGFYLVMEMLTGENLRERIARVGLLPVAEVVSILCAVTGALHAAHRAGVVHRDIKPENVFVRLDERGRPRGVKVLDFGISKLSEAESLTLTGQRFGTAHYLAPEQAAGIDGSSTRIDVYQLGVLGYELLTGRLPYEGESYAAVLVALMTTEHVPLGALRSELPPALTRAIELAMSRDPARRPHDALALAKLLEPIPGARFDEVLERALAESAGTERAMPAVSEQEARAAVAAPARGSPPTRVEPEPEPGLEPAPTRLAPIVLGGVVLAGVAATATLAALHALAPPPSAPPVSTGAVPIAAPPDAARLAPDAGTLPMGLEPPPRPAPPPVPPPDTAPAPPPDTATPRHHHHPHISADEF